MIVIRIFRTLATPTISARRRVSRLSAQGMRSTVPPHTGRRCWPEAIFATGGLLGADAVSESADVQKYLPHFFRSSPTLTVGDFRWHGPRLSPSQVAASLAAVAEREGARAALLDYIS